LVVVGKDELKKTKIVGKSLNNKSRCSFLESCALESQLDATNLKKERFGCLRAKRYFFWWCIKNQQKSVLLRLVLKQSFWSTWYFAGVFWVALVMGLG
jgi:hypothetical protein